MFWFVNNFFTKITQKNPHPELFKIGLKYPYLYLLFINNGLPTIHSKININENLKSIMQEFLHLKLQIFPLDQHIKPFLYPGHRELYHWLQLPDFHLQF